MIRPRLVPLVLLVVALAACQKSPPPAAPVVPAVAAPEAVPATPPPDAHAVPDATVAPDAAPPPRAVAPAVDPMFACRADAECTLLWLGRGCLPSDPTPVARAHEAAARQKLSKGPPLACGVGGPRYEEERRAILARYGVTCKAGRCALVDRGPQPSSPIAPTAP